MKKELSLNEYQEKAMKTCMPSCDNISYMLFNLVGEVGELASKIAKDIRKGNATIESNHLCFTKQFGCGEAIQRIEEYQKEAGDILWQLFGFYTAMGWKANDVAVGNLDKLADRASRGKIDGDGDNR
jgi:NTP pyrophosphatase (non-canonical NTP hydrolase)